MIHMNSLNILMDRCMGPLCFIIMSYSINLLLHINYLHVYPSYCSTYQIRYVVHVRKCVIITNMFLNSLYLIQNVIKLQTCHTFPCPLYITKSACCLSWIMHVKSTIMYMQSPMDNTCQASQTNMEMMWLRNIGTKYM